VNEQAENITLTEVAEITGGTVYGNGNTVIKGVCSLDNPRPDHIALALYTGNLKLEGANRPCALIVSKADEIKGIPLLIHKDPRLAFTLALRKFHGDPSAKTGIDPQAVVSPDAKVDYTAWVGPFSVIDDGAEIKSGAQISSGCYVGAGTIIGEKSRLMPNVTILHDVYIGQRCIIHSGVVIGSDGFGYTPTKNGNLKVPQVGRVEIGDDVEIGANTTIDRATLDATRIGDDVKIDNLVQVAHNVQIGAHTRIAAQVGVSGRVIIEGNVVIAGQAGFQNGIKVGEGSTVAGQAGVTRHVPPGSVVSGYPAREHKKALQILSAQNRLPEILERLEKIESKLEIKD
jgi:UDP-3-O-[3-hydroxymyristoyl] glucosamine N-acyltransferase